jgi:hypothetical protein
VFLKLKPKEWRKVIQMEGVASQLREQHEWGPGKILDLVCPGLERLLKDEAFKPGNYTDCSF